MIIIVDLLLMLIDLTYSILSAIVQTVLRPRLKCIDGELCLITGSGGRAGAAVRPGVCQRGGAPGAVGLQRGGQRADRQTGTGAGS
ncbi:hypothetical protein CgunFtcFv8_014368 [Champsocephalus gunnari]|uniref:Uncharacterized protein n=1 Tax=Champsocephalus gunnari TaxID=52237 RepID=A0AAN8HZV7_CHAGU|nr:hypothetical protein CgunFtcFv8_014368 [Champsocephalus gunnari]